MARALLKAHDFKELPIPQGGILWEDGVATNAPGFEVASGGAAANDASYTRPSLCHGRFPKAATSFGADAGADTHAHTIPSHNHGNTGSGSSKYTCCNTYGSSSAAYYNHVHSTNSNSANTSTDTVVPAYRTVRPMVYTMRGDPVRGLLTPRDLAASALPPFEIIIGYAQAGTPTGWRDCDGGTQNGVTVPNLVGKFLKGVPGAGTNPGSTGGTDNHAHDVSHNHGNTSQGGGGGVRYDADDEPKSDFADDNHVHTISSASIASDSASNHPANRTMRYLCFVGYGPNAHADPRGMVPAAELDPSLLIGAGLNAIWAKTLASIPSGWAHNTNFNDRMMRHVSSSADAGGTNGGSNSHVHTGGAHTHGTGGPSSYGGNTYSGDYSSSKTHTHITGAASYSALSTPVSNLPPYYEIAVIKRAA